MIRPTVADYAHWIADRDHFAQANYGDGEWGCLLGHKGQNVNGEVYTPELGEVLRETLLAPVGQWCGINPGNRLRAEVDRWIQHNAPNNYWVWKDVLSAANVNGELAPFFQACRTRNVVIIGPRHLKALDTGIIGRYTHIRVPDAIAWTVEAQIRDSLLDIIEPDDLVLFAAGMATNVMIWKLWPTLKAKVTLLDIGAIFDPYVGRFTRKGYRKEVFQLTNIKKNVA